MKELYYIHEVEEFHIGFEFEEHGYNGNTPNVMTWNPIIIKSKNWIITNEYVLTRTRVKYLDKEDIESLGFNHVYEDATLSQFEGNFVNEVTGEKEKNVILIKFKDDLCVSAKVRIHDMLDKEVNCLIIKNKSELKKLLNQLGIKI